MSLIKYFFSKQFIFFLIVGCINTCNGVIFSVLFNMLMNPTLSFIAGYTVGLIVSYLLNSWFVFKHPLKLAKFFMFGVSCIPNFLIQFICVVTLINGLDLMPIIAYTVSAIVGVPVTFLLMKIFAFKK